MPQDAIDGSLQARVKIYPNLLAHVAENLEAGLAVPHGCGEQTISSTYPSLLVTDFYATLAEPAVARTSQRYLQAGYERLLRYQDTSGGFTYWGHGDPDLALTAYALLSLTTQAAFIEVDSAVMQNEAGIAGFWGGRRRFMAERSRQLGDIEERDSETAYIAETLALVMDEKTKAMILSKELQRLCDSWPRTAN